MPITDLSFEKNFWDAGKIPAGVDEAGRGPLAGPVVAASVILSKNNTIHCIDDSKKLTEKKRVKLYNLIKENCVEYSIGVIGPEEIDEINILRATIKAMEISVNKLKNKPNFLLIDGNVRTSLLIPQEAIVKGDSKCLSIAAASIIAKVTRDKMMGELHKEYPDYNFKKHKGYPTKEHINAIKKYGPCPIHRRSFSGVL